MRKRRANLRIAKVKKHLKIAQKNIKERILSGSNLLEVLITQVRFQIQNPLINVMGHRFLNLNGFILCYGSSFLESEWIHFIKQIIEGVKYIHSRSILHNDINSNNVVLDITNTKVFIIDFGKATLVSAPVT